MSTSRLRLGSTLPVPVIALPANAESLEPVWLSPTWADSPLQSRHFLLRSKSQRGALWDSKRTALRSHPSLRRATSAPALARALLESLHLLFVMLHYSTPRLAPSTLLQFNGPSFSLRSRSLTQLHAASVPRAEHPCRRALFLPVHWGVKSRLLGLSMRLSSLPL